MNELYDSIARELGGTIPALRSTTLDDIMMHLGEGTVKTALSLVPQLSDIEYEQNRKQIA